MRRLLSFLLLAVAIAGCVPLIGPDRVRIREYSLWKNADLLVNPELAWVQVVPGKQAILGLEEGWSRSRRTTAHGSCDKVYLVLHEVPYEKRTISV